MVSNYLATTKEVVRGYNEIAFLDGLILVGFKIKIHFMENDKMLAKNMNKVRGARVG